MDNFSDQHSLSGDEERIHITSPKKCVPISDYSYSIFAEIPEHVWRSHIFLAVHESFDYQDKQATVKALRLTCKEMRNAVNKTPPLWTPHFTSKKWSELESYITKSNEFQWSLSDTSVHLHLECFYLDLTFERSDESLHVAQPPVLHPHPYPFEDQPESKRTLFGLIQSTPFSEMTVTVGLYTKPEGISQTISYYSWTFNDLIGPSMKTFTLECNPRSQHWESSISKAESTRIFADLFNNMCSMVFGTKRSASSPLHIRMVCSSLVAKFVATDDFFVNIIGEDVMEISPIVNRFTIDVDPRQSHGLIKNFITPLAERDRKLSMTTIVSWIAKRDPTIERPSHVKCRPKRRKGETVFLFEEEKICGKLTITISHTPKEWLEILAPMLKTSLCYRNYSLVDYSQAKTSHDMASLVPLTSSFFDYCLASQLIEHPLLRTSPEVIRTLYIQSEDPWWGEHPRNISQNPNHDIVYYGKFEPHHKWRHLPEEGSHVLQCLTELYSVKCIERDSYSNIAEYLEIEPLYRRGPGGMNIFKTCMFPPPHQYDRSKVWPALCVQKTRDCLEWIKTIKGNGFMRLPPLDDNKASELYEAPVKIVFE